MINPFFIPVIIFTAGMITGNYATYSFNLPLFMSIVLTILFLFSLREQNNKLNPVITMLPLYGIFFLLGFSLLQGAIWMKPDNHVSHFINRDVKALQGMVSSDINLSEFTLSVSMTDIQDISMKPFSYLEGDVKVSVAYDNELEKIKLQQILKRGNVVQFPGILRSFTNNKNLSSFSASRFYASKGLYAFVYVNNNATVKATGHVDNFIISRWINNYRNRMYTLLKDWASREKSFSGAERASSFLSAIFLGKRNDLDYEIRDEFRKAGLYHILAISGLHVGILGGIIYLPLMWIFRNRLRCRALVLICIVAFYAVITEGQPSVMRASLMIIVHLTGLLVYKEGQLLNTISISAFLLLLYEPLYLFQTGFQLTFLAVLSIYFLSDHVKLYILPWLSKTFAGPVLSISLAVQLGMSPVLANLFGMIPVLSFIPFLILLPVLVLILLLGFIMFITALFSTAICEYLLVPLHYSSLLFLKGIQIFSSMPLATVVTGSINIGLMLIYYGIIIYAVAQPGTPDFYRRMKPVLIGLFVITMIIPYINRLNRPILKVTFLDIGDGDCTLIQLPDGFNMFVDGGGTEDNKFDTARYVIIPYLVKSGIRSIDAVLASHAHADHMYGLINLMENFPVKSAYVSKRADLPKLYNCYLESIKANDVSKLGLMQFYVSPLLDCNENNHSEVVKISYGDFSVLLTGDIEKEAEESLLKYGDSLQSTILKVPHHGSRTSSSINFLQTVKADCAVISVSEHNRHNHPHEQILKRISSTMDSCKIFMTGQRGAISVISDGNKYKILGNGSTLVSCSDSN